MRLFEVVPAAALLCLSFGGAHVPVNCAPDSYFAWVSTFQTAFHLLLHLIK